jgi:hypothetical protein
MDESLKKKLQALLAEHPELNGGKVSFLEDGISLSSNSKDENYKPFSVEVITGNSPKVEVRLSTVHGYGVFAKENLEEGELIEQCRLLKLGNRAIYNNDPVLKDYVWAGEQKSSESKEHGACQYIALGFGSIYNHSDQPNTIQKLNFRTEVMKVKAARIILKDEEIFVSYGKKYFMIRNFWKGIHQSNALEKFFEKGQD